MEIEVIITFRQAMGGGGGAIYSDYKPIERELNKWIIKNAYSSH
jgi:hypothetical protein